MKLRSYIAAVAALVVCTSTANAWWDGGHETVAYIAYRELIPATRKRVDSLLQRNPMYDTWTMGIATDQRGLVAFVQAATWADCIKSFSCMTGYTSDGGNVPPGNPTDAQNIGYGDHLMHQYWHFIDEAYSAGAPGQPPKEPKALTEIKLLANAIGTDESTTSSRTTWCGSSIRSGISTSRCMPPPGSPRTILMATRAAASRSSAPSRAGMSFMPTGMGCWEAGPQ